MNRPRVVVEDVERDELHVYPESHRHAQPEDVAYLALQEQNALRASIDLFRMMAVPRFMQRWVTAMLHNRADGELGNNGAKTATNYISRLFEVMICGSLNVEIACTSGLSETWRIYPFGFACRNIVITTKIFAEDPAFMASLLRIVLVDQGNVTSPVFSSHGGAFSRSWADMTTNEACFSGFAYNQLLDFHFPRIQFVACYCATLAEHARYIDLNKGIDVDRVLAIADPLKCVELSHELRYRDSESVPVRMVFKCVFDKLFGDFTMRTQQFYLRREDLSAHGKPVTYAMYRQKISDAYEEMTRRADFYKIYMNKIREACELPSEESREVLFTPKHLTAVWLMLHYRATERAQEANSIKLTGFYFIRAKTPRPPHSSNGRGNP